MSDEPKRAAIDLDEIGSKRLSEISAAEFLQALEQAEAEGAAPAAPEELTVNHVIVGTRAALRLPFGGVREKKKVEREKFPLEKFSPEKVFEGFPEKKKVELEKSQFEKSDLEKAIEGFPEKKKVELEKSQFEKSDLEKATEGFPEKKKVELEKGPFEKQSIEGPEVLGPLGQLEDRLARIEQQMSSRSE